MQVDPEADNGQEDLKPYQFGYNDPCRYNDPSGRVAIPFIFAILEAIPVVGEFVVVGATVAAVGYGAYKLVEAGVARGATNNSMTLVPESMNRDAATLNSQQASSQQQPAASNQKNAPDANDGVAKKHGAGPHNDAIDKRVADLKEQGATNVRKNQQQVDANGNKVGKNRPDVQHDKKDQHYNGEFDNRQKAAIIT